jgi:hypothetical protein
MAKKFAKNARKLNPGAALSVQEDGSVLISIIGTGKELNP